MAVAELTDVTSIGEVGVAVDALASVVTRLVADALDRDGLLEVAALFARGSKLCAAATLLAPAIEEAAAFRRDGHRSTADLLATLGATSAGAAPATVETAQRMRSRPKTAGAVRRGQLSAGQADVLASVAAEDEERMLELAVSGRQGLKGLRDEAARCAHARRSEHDAMDAYRRVHRERRYRSWKADGGWCFSGFTTLDEGARFEAGFAAERERLFAQANRDDAHEHRDAYAIDALVNVVTGTDIKPRRPTAALTVRADAAAIDRGQLEAGETCEIDGYGPIPVTVARALLLHADIHSVVFDGHDVATITSTSRSIPAAVRRALNARDPQCCVPGCDQTKGLEIDHIRPYAKNGPTTLDNLVRLCRGHHRMKTIYGWQVTGPPGTREWLPPPDPGEGDCVTTCATRDARRASADRRPPTADRRPPTADRRPRRSGSFGLPREASRTLPLVAFIDELGAFIDANTPVEDNPAFVRALGEAGWVVPHWPRAYGGRGLTEEDALAVYAELDDRGLPRQPRGSGLILAAPTILQWSEEATKRRFLPSIASGAERWCQLFSEPGAGSDLASLATTAVRDGDEWVVNGQKVWTTYGHESEMAMLLTRTDPSSAKHAGITYFGLDMRARGVEIRPLVQMTGETEFNEVFLTDVRVPDLFRISPVNDGWAATQTTLGAERFALSGARKKKRASDEILGGKTIQDVIELARALGSELGAVHHHDVVRAYVDSRVLELLTARRVHGSLSKIAKAKTNQQLQLVAVELLGVGATAWRTTDADIPGFVRELLRTRANSIEGGTSEIQRNIVGERVLGLPREPDPFKGAPWTDVPRSVTPSGRGAPRRQG